MNKTDQEIMDMLDEQAAKLNGCAGIVHGVVLGAFIWGGGALVWWLLA